MFSELVKVVSALPAMPANIFAASAMEVISKTILAPAIAAPPMLMALNASAASASVAITPAKAMVKAVIYAGSILDTR